jgi:hypothetical protein
MSNPEFWLSGPVAGVCDELQPVAHSLLQSRAELLASLADRDAAETRDAAALYTRGSAALNTRDASPLYDRPGAAASIAFHARHIAGSIDRLLTYASGNVLSDAQRRALAEEKTDAQHNADLVHLVTSAIDRALDVVRSTDPASLGEARKVGSAGLPSTLRGLLFHIAEHTLMHAGQIRTTALALHSKEPHAQ